jgi:hypothetical protein
MNPSTQTISPLRQRMIDDMRMRKLSPKTQSHYLRAVRQFASFLHRPPDTASVEDLRKISYTWSITASRQSRSMRRSPG